MESLKCVTSFLFFTVVLNMPKTVLTSNTLTMIYLNRTIQDGENVLVSANKDETRKEALVTCVARRTDPQQTLVFQFYAQNSILLEPRDSSWLDNNSMEGFSIGRRRIVLEKGGFLKLQCAITTHNKSAPMETVSANFTFNYRDSNPTATFTFRPREWPIPNAVFLSSSSSTKRPVIPPPVMHVNNNSISSANNSHSIHYILTFMNVIWILFCLN